MAALIRDETFADTSSVREITMRAFSESELGHHGETDLIDRLRSECPNRLSLVAELDHQLVGHILFTPVMIRGKKRSLEGMGLAPMSVLPEFQQRGIGTELINTALERLRESQCPFAVVLGHPAYYARFGFEPACKYGISCEFADVPEKIFRLRLVSASPSTMFAGVAKYHREFSAFE